MRVSKSKFLGTLVLFLILFSPVSSFLAYIVGQPIRMLDDFLLSILVLFYLIGKRTKAQRIDHIFKIFILGFAVSVFYNSLDEGIGYETFMQARIYMLPPVIFYICRNQYFDISERIYRFLHFVIVLMCSLGIIELVIGRHIFAVINLWGNETYSDQNFRIYSLVGNPADYGYYLVFIYLLYNVVRLVQHKPFGRWQGFVGFLVFINLLATVSMGPIIAMIGASAIMGLFFVRHPIVNKRVIVFLSLMLITFNVVMPDSMMQKWTGRVLNRVEQVVNWNQNISDEASRLDFYYQSIPVIKDSPIIGVGPGHYGGSVATKLGSVVHEKFGINTYEIGSIDVFYPHYIGEQGLIGFICLLIMIIRIVSDFYKSSKYSRKVGERDALNMANLCIFTTLYLVLTGIWSMVIETTPLMILFWAIIGIGYGNMGKIDCQSLPRLKKIGFNIGDAQGMGARL